MDGEQLTKAFTATVQASLHGLRLLKPVLECEYQALAGRDSERLEQYSAEKLELLKQLQHGIQARNRLQEMAGLEKSLAGGAIWVERLADPSLRAEWQEMETLAHEVAEFNDRNGQLAAQSQRVTREALAILTGRPDRQDTYADIRRGGPSRGGYSLGKV